MLGRVGNWIKEKAEGGARRKVTRLLQTATSKQLTGGQIDVVQDSIENKYIPSLRDATTKSLMFAPALAVAGEAANGLTYTMVGAMIVAWFAITLQDVSKKFEDFGVEITKDMMDLLYTGLYSIAGAIGISLTIKSAPEIVEGVKNSVEAIHRNDGTLQTITEAAPGGLKATAMTLAVCFGLKFIRYMSNTLVACTLKYDLNDAFLGGKGELERDFYQYQNDPIFLRIQNISNIAEEQQSNYEVLMILHEIGTLTDGDERFQDVADRIKAFIETHGAATAYKRDYTELDTEIVELLSEIKDLIGKKEFSPEDVASVSHEIDAQAELTKTDEGESTGAEMTTSPGNPTQGYSLQVSNQIYANIFSRLYVYIRRNGSK